MLFGIPLGEVALLVAGILVGGVASGLLAGLFGIGGGAIIVPVLYEVFRALGVPEDVRMQLCLGTSMAIIVPTTFRSYLAHRAKGAVLHDVVRRWAVPAVAGIAVGSTIAYFAPSVVFKLVFMTMVTIIGLKLLFVRNDLRIADDLPGPVLMNTYGFMIGLISSFMGVAGGSISNVIQMLYGKPLHNAVATSAGLGVPITIAGAIGYMIAGWPKLDLLPPLSIGYVSLIGLVIMAPVSSYTAAYGVRLAHRLSKRQLEVGFGIFLLVIATRFAISLV